MKKIELNIVGLSYSQAQSNSYALVLGEVNGKRRLPIVIGHYEAQAIALELEKMKPSRPLTHDLFLNLATTFGILLEEVIITRFHEGIFYATLICNDGNTIQHIDSRTSDAVALAIRFHCPIYTYEDILSQAGIVFDEDETLEEAENKSPSNEFENPATSRTNEFNLLTNEELDSELRKAVENEEYERASLIRDEIRKRK